MKKGLLNPVKIGMLCASFTLVCGVASGQTFTAVASGNWSSAATWGGSTPLFNLLSAAQINIGAGINVTMDENVTLNNALSQINVSGTGTLSANPNLSLNIVSGALTGSGSINVNKVILNSGGSFTFTGNLTADTLLNSISSLSSEAKMLIEKELTLNSGIDVSLGGSLTMGANSNITVSGGSISVTGGTLNLSAAYSVNYTTLSATTGSELSGSGLGNVTINVGNANDVILSSNLVTNGSLEFNSGTLMLNGYNLTANGEVTGSVMLAGNSNSNLTINTPGGLSASMAFAGGYQNLNNLAINVGSGNSVEISSDLTVNGNLAISGGNKLNISGVMLTVAGNITGTGLLAVNGSSDIALTASHSITGNINITGPAFAKLVVNTGNSNMVALGTGLNVDTLDLATGALVLNGNNLTVNGDISAGGTGIVYSTSPSNISLSAATALHGALAFDANWDTVNNFSVNVGGGGSVMLGSNLVINGNLDLTNGYVNLESNMLNIGAAGSISGAGLNAYVITSGGGSLTMNATVSNPVTFPVGTLLNYLPAQITLNPGSATGSIGVNVSNGVFSLGILGIEISATQPMVNATWLFQNNIGSGLNANMQLAWTASAEVNGFTLASDYISHFASEWDNIGDSMTAMVSGGMYFVTRANITSMSPFAVFDKQTATAINEIAKSAVGIEIYPNPTSENLYIHNTTGSAEPVMVEIYNVLGEMVSNSQFNGSVTSIPVNGLPAGNYFIKLYNDNLEVVKKFSKL